MPLAKEIVLGFGTLSGTDQNGLDTGDGQSFTVRNFSTGQARLLEVVAADDTGPFELQIKSPKMHDTTYGLQFASSPQDVGGTAVFNPQRLLPSYASQKLYATDTLVVSMAGQDGDIVAALLDMYYTDLSGISARLFAWDAIEPLIENLAGVIVTPESSATEGSWGDGVALNSGKYALKADTDYAVLGYQVSKPCIAVGILGTDTGNLYVGGPGSFDAGDNGAYFVDESVKYKNTPFAQQIPVINSNNAPGITVNVASLEASETIEVSLILAQLSTKLVSPGGVS
jgi:hypothetical protein